MVTGLWYTHDPNFVSLSWFWRCKDYPCPLSPHLGLLRMLEAPDWVLASWSWFGYGLWFLIHPWSKIWLFFLILKVQRTAMSFNSSYEVLEDDWDSWLGFGILVLNKIWSLVFDTPMTQILALYLVQKVQRTFMSFKSWFGVCILILISIWSLDSWSWFGHVSWSLIHLSSKYWLTILIWDLYLDLDMITGLWYTHDPNFGALS